jgi:hypothetical protein
MSNGIAGVVTARVPRAHASILRVAEKLSEDQVAWRANVHAPSIGFHLWHVARWADRLQARMPKMAPGLLQELGSAREIWEAEQLARAWGLTPAELGFGDTGMEMGDDMSATMVLPAKTVLMGYAQRAFEAADRAVGAVEDRHFALNCTDLYDRESTIGLVILMHLGHVNRHVGMTEALTGVQGLTGSATV